MGTSLQTSFITSVLALCLAWPVFSQAGQPIPEEPGEEQLVGQSYDTIIGLFFREYSLRENGHVDYRTARHILGISYDDPAAEALDVAPYPIFYWYDPHQDGRWEIWVDRGGEGWTAAERAISLKRFAMIGNRERN
ncbi:MAG: exported protein of unknown function [Nitrospira sp.]|nr:exported protein of unknown function [Nitrospira sp.]